MTLPPEFHDLAKRVNNWGRWGDDDERGTLNLITPERVRDAAALVRTGERISLAIPLSEKGPQTGSVPGRVNPSRTMTAIHTQMTRDPADAAFSDDAVYMGLQCATHWDSLAHVSYDGRVYNGLPASAIDVRGASKLGIDKTGVVAGRGVLLDVPRALGRDWLDGGYAITPADLDAACELGRLTVGPGDIVLVRTGAIRHLHNRDRKAYSASPSPGLGMACAQWFRDRDVAAAASDTLMFEAWPWDGDVALGLHLLDLVEMGMTHGENWDLETLAESCAADGRYAFFLSAPPEPFARGLGAPVHPVALK